MPRQNDPVLHHDDRSFWEYIEIMDDGRKSCTFCGHVFAKDTAITRIKFHLAQVEGRDVQEAALAAIDGPAKKKLKTRAGSSNNKVTNAISASAQEQNNAMMMAHPQQDFLLDDWMASITAEDEEVLVIDSFHERTSVIQADEPRGDPSQPTNDQLHSPSVNNDVIMNDAQNVWEFRAWNKVGRKGEYVRI
ncbi:disease resistance protein [Salix suchowensis]|nr:disease resistance protein [Salix suchowensis]